MARTRGELHPDDVQARFRVRAVTDLHEIQVMERDELLGLQRALGYGATWGLWEAPKAWVAKGPESARMVRYADSAEQDERVGIEVLRVCLLWVLSPAGRAARDLAPSTVVQSGRALVRLSKRCAKKVGPATGWWSRLCTADVVAEIKKNSAARLLSRLNALYVHGWLADVPTAPIDDAGAIERDRQGESLEDLPQDESREWQPLPDQFTSQCGWRVLWLVEHLGQSLLDCLEACLDWEAPAGYKPLHEMTQNTQRCTLSRVRGNIIERWIWRDGRGKPIAALPFDLHFRSQVKSPSAVKKTGLPRYEAFAWPPRRWGELMTLLGLLQTCHLWLLLLASGPRSSTVLSYTIHCLLDTPTGPQLPGRLQGQQFKNTRQLGGRARDWPLPPRLVRATKQQIRLANLVRRLGRPGNPVALGEDLWVKTFSFNGTQVGAPKLNVNDELDRMVDLFGLRHLLDTDHPTVHSHRFRKTLARLIALAMSCAQLVLMDTFGHDDPDQTLGYMLSDRTIAADALRVQRELVILMAVDAINDAENLAGAKGVEIREQTYRFLRLKGTSKLDPQDVYELADHLTLGGRTFRQVAPGLICTVPFLDAAPCGKGKGVRYDPSNCQSDCRHRLVMPYRLMFVDDQIASMLPQLQRALDEDNPMMVAAWVPRIQNYLFEAPTIYQKWHDHPLIQAHCDHSKQPYFSTQEVA